MAAWVELLVAMLMASSICLHRSSSWWFNVVCSSCVVKLCAYVLRLFGGQLPLGFLLLCLRVRVRIGCCDGSRDDLCDGC